MDFPTLAIAIYGAVVATVSVVIGGVAIRQARAHFGRPNWGGDAGAAWDRERERAQLSWRVVNYGPREATEVIFLVRPPGKPSLRHWLVWHGATASWLTMPLAGIHIPDWLSYREKMEAGAAEFFQLDPRMDHPLVVPPGDDNPGEPLYGLWRFRIEWREAPRPDKVRRKYWRHRIRRSFKVKHPVYE